MNTKKQIEENKAAIELEVDGNCSDYADPKTVKSSSKLVICG